MHPLPREMADPRTAGAREYSEILERMYCSCGHHSQSAPAEYPHAKLPLTQGSIRFAPIYLFPMKPAPVLARDAEGRARSRKSKPDAHRIRCNAVRRIFPSDIRGACVRVCTSRAESPGSHAAESSSALAHPRKHINTSPLRGSATDWDGRERYCPGTR